MEIAIALLSFIIGLVLFRFSIASHRDIKGFIATSVTTTGSVVEVIWEYYGNSEFKSRKLFVSFTPKNSGSAITFQSNHVPLFDPKEGSPIQVRYDPENPATAEIATFFAVWLGTIFLSVFSGLSFVIAAVAMSFAL